MANASAIICYHAEGALPVDNLIDKSLNRPVSVQTLAWVVLAVALLSFVTGLILSHGLYLQTRWPDYADMVTHLDQPAGWLRWVLGDLSEFAFFKHELAGIGLLLGAGLAWWANRNGHAWQGFAIAYGTGLGPWLVASSLLGLLLSNLLWGWTVTAESWQPTFVPFVSLPAAVVLMFGRGWRIAITGAVLGALLVAPACLLLVNLVSAPLGLPNMVGAGSGMAAGSAAALLLCRRFPQWVAAPRLAGAERVNPPQRTPRAYGWVWGIRRALADFTEAPFLGNEWASLGLLGGILLAYLLNPDSTVYGSGLLLSILAAQCLTSAFGVALWRQHWITQGWYPTYVPLVSVAPTAVLTHGGSATVILLSASLGALIAPPLARWLAGALPRWMHGFIANVASMALSTLLIVPAIGLIIG